MRNTNEQKEAVLYLRVSTQEQAREAFGLESQEASCRELCDERGLAVREVFKDEGVSAYADVERPAFRQMMAFLRKNRHVVLVFVDFSRFGRDTLKALTAFEELEKLRVRFMVVAHPDIDFTKAAGRKFMRDELSVAENFSEKNSEQTVDRMYAAFKAGRWPRRAPLGYENVRCRLKGQPNIVPKQPEADYIVRAFELVRAGTHTLTEVLRSVTEMGLRSINGKALDLHTFKKTLQNVAYIGKMRSNKWRETVDGLHAPLVDLRLFQDVQLILKGKKPIAAPYQRNNPNFPLRRFVRCGECERPLTGAPSKSENGSLYGYYRCYVCGAVKGWRTDRAEAAFVAQLERLKPSALLLSDFAHVLRDEWEKQTGDDQSILRGLEAELRVRQDRYARLMDKFLDGDKVVERIFADADTRLRGEIVELEAKIAEAQTRRATFDELMRFSRSMLVDIAAAWQRAELDQKQRVQNALFADGLFYDPKTGNLNSRKPCLFNELEGFVAGNMEMARPERFELPT